MNDITETTNDPNNEWLENYPYEAIEIGQAARIVRTLTLADTAAKAWMSANVSVRTMRAACPISMAS